MRHLPESQGGRCILSVRTQMRVPAMYWEGGLRDDSCSAQGRRAMSDMLVRWQSVIHPIHHFNLHVAMRHLQWAPGTCEVRPAYCMLGRFAHRSRCGLPQKCIRRHMGTRFSPSSCLLLKEIPLNANELARLWYLGKLRDQSCDYSLPQHNFHMTAILLKVNQSAPSREVVWSLDRHHCS